MSNGFQPLAAKLRPTSLEQYVGQQHIIGERGPVRNMLASGKCHSLLLWGPPGTGKTTLIKLIAEQINAELIELSAVSAGVKDIRETVHQAQQNNGLFNRQTIVFVDEIHRFNKSQQDAFLPYVESGDIVLIGATTENPAFSINRALLSRIRVFILKPLSDDDLAVIIERALIDVSAQYSNSVIRIDDNARLTLIANAQGDARALLSTLELCIDICTDNRITLDDLVLASGQKLMAFDKNGDHYYDILSAFHKSVRGSSTNGALFWYAAFIEGGGEATVVARRLLAIASEDIGNADPKALQLCLTAWDVFHRVGPAEGERAIAQAAIYCALAPKSNAVYMAFSSAKEAVKKMHNIIVPNHLRNAPTSLAKSMDHGKHYRYAHNEANAYAAGEQYLPENYEPDDWYQPSNRGLEKKLNEKIAYLKQLDNGQR